MKVGTLEDQLRKLKGRPQGAFGTVERRFVNPKDAVVICLIMVRKRQGLVATRREW